MKRFFLLLVMALLTLPTWAGSGAEQSDAIDFSWESTGNEQEAGTTLWYKVGLGDVAIGMNVLLYLSNESITTDATITATIYLSNGTEVESGTKYIAARTSAAFEIPAGIVSSFSVVYVKLTTDQPINFAAEAVLPGEKDLDCLSATALNFAGTNHAADATQWYSIDLSGVREDTSKSLKLTIENKGTEEAVINASLSVDCPSTGTMDQALTIGANSFMQTTLKRSQLNMLSTDEVYVRMHSNQALFITVEEVAAPESTLPELTAPVTAIPFVVNQDYTLPAGETWFAVPTVQFSVPGTTAELKIIGNDAAGTTIEGDLLYETPSKDYTSSQLYVDNGQIYVRDLPRNMVEQVCTKTTMAYVRLVSTEEVTFSIRLKTVVEGDMCLTAKELDWAGEYRNGNENTTWYKVGIKDIKEDPTAPDVLIKITNRGNAATLAKASVAFDCPVTTPTVVERVIDANATATKVILNSMFANLAVDTIYVGIASAEDLLIQLKDTTAAPFEEITACEDAIPFEVATDYPQEAGAEVWYEITLNDFVNAQNQVPEIKVTNHGTALADVLGEVAYACPVTQAMQSKIVNVFAGATRAKLVTSDMINNAIDPSVETLYVRVTSNQPITIRVDMKIENEGNSCGLAIPIDWNEGNIHPAGDSLWYVLDLRDTLKTETRDLELKVTNLSAEAVSATYTIKTACSAWPLFQNYTDMLAGSQDTVRIVSNEILQDMFREGTANDAFYLFTTSSKDIRFDVRFVDDVRVEVYDTTRVYGGECVGTDYTYKNNDSTFTHFLDVDRATWMWNDTITFDVSILEKGDSIFTHIVIPTQAPDTFFTDPASLALPVITEGMYINMKATTDDILAKYDAIRNLTVAEHRDTIAVVDTITWGYFSDPADPNSFWVELKNDSLVLFGADKVALRYSYETACQEWIYSDIITFDVQEGLFILNDTIRDTLCVNDDYTTKAGLVLAIAQDTIINDTLLIDNYKADTIQAQNVFVQDLKVWRNLVLPAELDTLIHPQVGQLLDITVADAILQDTLQKQVAVDALVTRYTNATWEILDTTTNTFGALPTEVLGACDSIYLRYVVDATCDSLFSDTLKIAVTSIVRQDTLTTDTLCVGALFNSRLQKDLEITVDTVFFDSIRVEITPNHWVDSIYNYELTVWRAYTLPEVANLFTLQVGLPIDTTSADAALRADLDAQKAADELLVAYTTTLWEVKNADGVYESIIPTKAVEQTETLSLRYTVITECVSQHQEFDVAVAPISKQETTIAYTLCAGETYISRLQTLTIAQDTTFADTVRVANATGQVVDSIYNYDLKVWRELQLPDVADLITPQVGLPLDTTAAATALRANLDAQNAADDLIVGYTTITWEIQNAAGEYTEILATPLEETDSISLRYMVITDCDSLIQTFNVAVLPILEQTTTIADTLCVGETYISRLQTLTIAQDTIFADTVRVPNETAQVVDSIYNYTLYVWRELQLPDLSDLITPQVGLPLDTTAAAAALRENLAEQATDPLTVDYTTITWTILNDGADEAITAEPLDEMTTITLHYTIETACGRQDTMLTVEVAPILEQPVTITDTLCAGDTYLSRLQTLTITQDTLFADTVRGANETGQVVDSIYNYALYVFVPITLPATLTELPEAICGQPLHIDLASTALMAELEALVQPINSTIDTLVWEIKIDATYTDAALVDTVPALTDADLTVRYYVITSCNDTLYSEDILLTVAGPTADNTDILAAMPAVSKYNGWLLMINLNEINARGFFPTEDEVEWYKIQGEADFAATATSDPLDSIVGTGYYFTTGHQLNGEYYAVIDMLPDTLDACGAILRTVTLTCTSTSASVSIAPNIAAPGEDITINGLNPTLNYTLDIYNLTGILVEHITISNASTYTFKAQNMVGYYMLNVQTDEVATSLKYIVK